jgi:ABC-type multidrug transport system fused ATPase/permease subunit
MTAPSTPPSTAPSTDAWRGVAAEDADDIGAPGLGTFLRSRSRGLLASLLRPHKRLIWASLGIIVVFNLSSLVGPMMVGLAVDRGIPPLLRAHGATSGPLVTIVLIFVVASLVNAVCDYLFDRVTGRVGQDILYDLRLRLFDHFQRLSISFHESYTSGRVVSRLTSDIDAISELLNFGLQTLAWSLLSVVSIVVLLALLDIPLSFVAWAAFSVVVAGTIWFRINSARAYRATREAIALVIVHFVESLAGIRAVQAFRREPRNQEIFEDVDDRYRAANRWAAQLIGTYGPGTRIVGGISTGAVLFVGAHRVIHGDIKVGVLIAFLLYLRRFFEPVQELAQFYNAFQSAAAALEKLSGVLDEPPAVAEPADPTPLVDAAGEIRFEDVAFHYREGRPVLPAFDLLIPAGQTVALVGETGAGKTTVARLIGRFYDPNQGRVLLDGIDLRDLAVDDLRRAVITVTQENFLFSGSVADNIEFGRPGASRAEIINAAEAIGAHDFIAALPDGYDTDVRKRGGRLSAGQRQLVSFARAFLADPHVLILDEATSSLDIPSERLVQHALRTLLADRTAVIIAHRLSTVEIADRVLVIDGGRIVEDGSPDELIGGGGRYHALHQAWADSLV